MHQNIHSHIKSLGISNFKFTENSGKKQLNDNEQFKDTLISSKNIKFWCNLVIKSALQLKNMNFLIYGSSGKDAVVQAIKEELKKSVLKRIMFLSIDASELQNDFNSFDDEKLLILMRKNVFLRIKEIKDVYEGEVVSIKINKRGINVNHDVNVNHGIDSDNTTIIMVLRATKDSETVKLDGKFIHLIRSEGIEIGDIVYLENNLIKRLGRSEKHAQCDLESDTFIPLPKGRVKRTREIIQEISVHDLDIGLVADKNDFMHMQTIRDNVDLLVKRYLDSGVAELIPSIVVIRNVNNLSYNPAFDLELKPITIITSRNGGEPGIASRFLQLKIDHLDYEKILKRRIEYVGLTGDCNEVAKFLSKFPLKFGIRIIDVCRSIDENVDLNKVKEIVEMFSFK
ncbi:RuvB-like helicase 1 [Dictyocoela muelleri]|nr:RuvB-like helicase 1 [Dictyocoela muelleri]